MFQSEIIADSTSATHGKRLVTYCITYPRIVLAEFNTHRMLSRNTESSRAVPFHKKMEAVMLTPFIPEYWGQNQSGMQAHQQISEDEILMARATWLNARDEACHAAERLSSLGVHKQTVNRLIEPFSWTTTVVSATEWNNFFQLRCHEAAQPEIRKIAEMMKAQYIDNEPNSEPLEAGEWHLPWVSREEKEAFDVEVQKGISVARVARTSFTKFDGTKSIEEELASYNRMSKQRPLHASPFEHIATPMRKAFDSTSNFFGWEQLRSFLSGQSGADIPIQ